MIVAIVRNDDLDDDDDAGGGGGGGGDGDGGGDCGGDCGCDCGGGGGSGGGGGGGGGGRDNDNDYDGSNDADRKDDVPWKEASWCRAYSAESFVAGTGFHHAPSRISHLFMPLASGFIWHKDPGFIRGRPDNARRSRELSEEMIWHFFHGSLVA